MKIKAKNNEIMGKKKYKNPPINESINENSVSIRKISEISQLEAIYSFHNPDEIKRFLSSHDFIIEYLFEEHEQIRRFFGEHIIEILLEYDKDPNENFEGLFVTIKTNLSPAESIDLLEKFDEEWWLGIDFKIRSKITIMVRAI